eukprot:14331309-Alexandrium_andersonii.AAC.1
MDKRMHASRGPGSYPGKETLYVSDVDLGSDHVGLCMRERDRRVLRTVLNQDHGCISDAGAHPPCTARAAPFNACVAVAWA